MYISIILAADAQAYLKTKMVPCSGQLSYSDISKVTDIVTANNRLRFAVEHLGIDCNKYRTIEADAKFIHHDTLYECIRQWKYKIEAEGNNAKDEMIRILAQIRVEQGWLPDDGMAFIADVKGVTISQESK